MNMNVRIISDIVNIVQKCININFKFDPKQDLSTKIDPELLFTIRTERIALAMGVLISLKLRDDKNIPLDGNDLLKDMKIIKDKFPWVSTLLNYHNKLGITEQDLFNKWYMKISSLNYDEITISSIYESLLSYEWVFDEAGFHVKSDKSSRNRSGSYYTPDHLAEVSIRKVLDQKIEDELGISEFSFNPIKYKRRFNDIFKLLLSFKIIDFSCGTGQFLKSVIDYIANYLLPIQPNYGDNMNKQEEEDLISLIIGNIWGVDIDFIALEIAKSEILTLTDNQEIQEKVNKQFIHGNPLIPASFNIIPDEEKRKLTAAGYLYHIDLGLNWGIHEEEIKKGFELIVGNPPWEKLRFEEKSFFLPWAPHISKINKKNDRSKEIEKLKHSHPLIYQYYTKYISQLDASKELIKRSHLFNNSAVGELNTYALFTELASSFVSKKGRVCYIVKSAIVVSPVNKRIFQLLLSEGLIGCYDFINRKNIFDIDNRERFCVLILGKNDNNYFRYKAGLTQPDELLISDGELRISEDILNLLNPLTGMLPSVTDSSELRFLIEMHSLHPVLEQEFPDCKFGRLVHFTNHADFIDRELKDDNIPIYEGKFIDLYDGRYSTYEGVDYDKRYSNKASSIVIPEAEKKDSTIFPTSRYFIKKDKWESLNKNYKEDYSLMWRSLTSSSNRRTTISTILPHCPASQSVQFLQLENKKSLTILLSLFNSVVFDYMVRLKLNGIDLTQTILKQIAVPSKKRFETQIVFNGVNATFYDHIAYRVALLLSNDARMISYSSQIMPINYPNKHHQYENRKEIIAEIDQLIAKVYDINEVTFKRILLSFPSFYSQEELDSYFGKEKEVSPYS